MYKLGLVRICLLGLLLALLAGIANYVSADTNSPWLNDTLSFQNEGEVPSSAYIPPSINGNRDCINHRFVTRPLRPLQSEVSHTSCAVQTAYGLVDSGGWLEFNGTGTAGKLTNYPGYSIGSIPVPNSKVLINYLSTGVGAQLHFNQNIPLAVLATTAINGEVTYKINSPAQISLRDRANNLLLVQNDTVSFSGNGKWMVVDAKNRAVLRVNLETFDVLPFAPSFNYSIGLDPSAKTAITSDGRYAVVYSKNFSTFKLYDLDTCEAVPNSINAPVLCQSKDLRPLAQNQIPGLQTIARIRFIDNENIVFYASYQPADQMTKIAKFRLTSGEVGTSNLELIALGDSYISGEGAFEYKPGTDTQDNKCHLSMLSYPFLASSAVGLNTYQSVACSGAVIQDLLDNSGDYKGQALDGIKREDRDANSVLGAFRPGYINQLDFVKKHIPKHVLVSIGGNDIGFSSILKRCLSPDTCYGTHEDRLELVRLINSRFPELVNTYIKIREHGTLSAKVFAVGYPQIAHPGGECDLNVRLNSQELEFAKHVANYLNSIIKLAADKAGVAYINNEDALNGHKLCEGESHNAAVNGLTAGNDTPSFLNGPIGNESYHPNKLGHELLAKSVLAKSDNLTILMPLPGSSAVLPNEEGLEILNAPKSNRAINKANYDNNLTNDIVYREMWWDITLDGIKHSVFPFSPLSLILLSEPLELGEFNTDTSGSLTTEIRIPASVPAGFHTLHLYGKNMAGETIDVFKTIYVAANEFDYDGDGLANSVDSCPTFENSGFDTDKDGIDDACDGYIGRAPVQAPDTPQPPVTNETGPGDTQTESQTEHLASLVIQPATSQAAMHTGENSLAFSPESSVETEDIPSAVLPASIGLPDQPTSAQRGNQSLPNLGSNDPKPILAALLGLLVAGLLTFRRLLGQVYAQG